MSGFITAEGLVIPIGSDFYDYVNDQRRLASSIRSVVSVADNTGFGTVAAGMATDGRPTTDANPLIAFNQAAKGLQWQGTAAGPLPLMPAKPYAHAGATAGFQTIATSLTAVNLGAAQHLAGGVTFASNGLKVPIAGYYRINMAYYTSGGAGITVIAIPYLNGTTQLTGGLRYMKSTTDDYLHHAVCTVLLSANDVVTLEAQHSASLNTWGTSGYNGTYLELEYMGAV